MAKASKRFCAVEKRCSCCGMVKPINVFHRDSSRSDGFSTYCKDCENAKKKEYRKNPEQKKKEREYQQKRYYSKGGKEAAREYWQKNKEKCNHTVRNYRKTSEKYKRYTIEYRKKHRGKIASYQREYRGRNPEVVLAHYLVRAAIENGILTRLPCEKCGDEASEAHHKDYNKPLDVVWSCKRCHMEWHRNNKAIH